MYNNSQTTKIIGLLGSAADAQLLIKSIMNTEKNILHIINSAFRFRVFTGTDNKNDCHCIPFFFSQKPDTKTELKLKSLQSVAPKVQDKKTTTTRLYPKRYRHSSFNTVFWA